VETGEGIGFLVAVAVNVALGVEELVDEGVNVNVLVPVDVLDGDGVKVRVLVLVIVPVACDMGVRVGDGTGDVSEWVGTPTGGNPKRRPTRSSGGLESESGTG
jgi:hypothetical protein